MRAGEVVQAVCQEYGIGLHELQSESRKHKYLEARQMVCYVLKDQMVMSELASLIGRKDHTTVSNAIQRMDDYLKIYKHVKARFERICLQLNINDNDAFMKLKLTRGKLEAIWRLLSVSLDEWPPDNVADTLIHEIITGLVDRLHTRIRRLESNSNAGASMKLTKIEAMALHVYWHNMELAITDQCNQFPYEIMVTRDVFHQIDKQLA